MGARNQLSRKPEDETAQEIFHAANTRKALVALPLFHLMGLFTGVFVGDQRGSGLLIGAFDKARQATGQRIERRAWVCRVWRDLRHEGKYAGRQPGWDYFFRVPDQVRDDNGSEDPMRVSAPAFRVKQTYMAVWPRTASWCMLALC